MTFSNSSYLSALDSSQDMEITSDGEAAERRWVTAGQECVGLSGWVLVWRFKRTNNKNVLHDGYIRDVTTLCVHMDACQPAKLLKLTPGSVARLTSCQSRWQFSSCRTRLIFELYISVVVCVRAWWSGVHWKQELSPCVWSETVVYSLLEFN